MWTVLVNPIMGVDIGISYVETDEEKAIIINLLLIEVVFLKVEV